MIADLQPYPAYKNAGVAWFGEIPGHWRTLPNRATFVEVNERGFPNEQMLSVTITQGVIRQTALLADSSKKDSSNEDRFNYKLVCVGQIAYNKMRAWQGAVGTSRYRGIVSPAYVVVRPRRDDDPRYFHYLLRTPAFAREAERWSYGISSDQWSLRPEEFKQIYCCVPPRSEQSAIVRFLQHADRRIQLYIGAKKRLIALLNEYKQAIIHHAVTRGLDPSVHLRSSGVRGLGDVAEHWEVRSLGRFITLQRGFDITKEQQIEGAVPVVSSGGVLSYHNDATSGGPGVIVGRKGSVGTVHYIEGSYWAHDTTLWVKEFNGNHPRFVYYVLAHLDLKRFDTGSANPTLNRNLVHPEVVALPPSGEQRTIAFRLDRELAAMDKLVGNSSRSVSLLREHRTRLLADVVTGKLDVREAAAKLPDEAEEAEPLEDTDVPTECDVEAEDTDPEAAPEGTEA